MVSRPPFVSGSSPNHDGGEPKDNDAAMRCVITHSGRRFIADENSCRAFYYGVRGPTQIAMSPIVAAGKLPINTVGRRAAKWAAHVRDYAGYHRTGMQVRNSGGWRHVAPLRLPLPLMERGIFGTKDE